MSLCVTRITDELAGSFDCGGLRVAVFFSGVQIRVALERALRSQAHDAAASSVYAWRVSPDEALIAVLGELSAQRKLLGELEASSTSPPGPALYRTALDLIEKRATAGARALVADPKTPPTTKQAARAYVDDVEARARSQVRVADHLLAIARDWSCPSCKEDVVDACAVSLVSAGRSGLRVELVCANCKRRSPPAKEGLKVFDRLFGPLVSSSWNPEAHGLLWDRR
jgi:hypothetical protein